MSEIRSILGNSTMAYTNMDKNINGNEVIKAIYDLLCEDKENIIKANKIDVKNKNGFSLEWEQVSELYEKVSMIEDSYRKVISMNKNANNYLEGKQTDNLGNICAIYDGNTYCLLELVMKAILTHNSLILVSETDYMKATNELIIILVQRILKAYNIDNNLIQILYTTEIEELLSNSITIGKAIVIGNKSYQNRIRLISKVNTIYIGYNTFDLYVDDDANLSFIKKIIKQSNNIDIYVKTGLKFDYDEVTEVEDVDEAIGMINFNTSGYSSSIFTSDNQNASQFLKEVKSKNVAVNSSPLIEDFLNIDINEFLIVKNMIYPNLLAEGTQKSKFQFPTVKSILEKNKMKEQDNKIKEQDEIIASMENENSKLKKENQNILNESSMQIKQKDKEVNDLKRQLEESQTLANKYMNIFRKSFFTRLFGKMKKEEIDNDTKLLS